MDNRRLWALAALAGYSLVALPAAAQLPGGLSRNPIFQDGRGENKFKIKRRTVRGTVKSLDPAKKVLLVDRGKGGEKTEAKQADAKTDAGKAEAKSDNEIPVDVGPSVIRAGKGGAKYEDIQVGDKITVFGEVTIQGGLRAMEITLPAERMTIPPPPKVKRPKPEKKSKKSEKKTDEKTGDEKDGEEKADEMKADDAKSEPKSEEPKADEPKPEEKKDGAEPEAPKKDN